MVLILITPTTLLFPFPNSFLPDWCLPSLKLSLTLLHVTGTLLSSQVAPSPLLALFLLMCTYNIHVYIYTYMYTHLSLNLVSF